MNYRVWGIEQSTGVSKTFNVTAENMAKAEQLAALQYDLDVEGAAAVEDSLPASAVPRQYSGNLSSRLRSGYDTLAAFSVLSIILGIFSSGIGVFILFVALNAANEVGKTMRSGDSGAINNVLAFGGTFGLLGAAPFFAFAVILFTVGLIGRCVRDVALRQDA